MWPVPQDAWQRRFERVRREYEQRAQSRGGSPSISATAMVARTEVTLSWTNPPNTMSAVISATAGGTAVDISGSTTDGTDDLTVTAPMVTATITGLTTGTTYTFTIETEDSNGNRTGIPATVVATPASATVVAPPPQPGSVPSCPSGASCATLNAGNVPVGTTQVVIKINRQPSQNFRSPWNRYRNSFIQHQQSATGIRYGLQHRYH